MHRLPCNPPLEWSPHAKRKYIIALGKPVVLNQRRNELLTWPTDMGMSGPNLQKMIVRIKSPKPNLRGLAKNGSKCSPATPKKVCPKSVKVKECKREKGPSSQPLWQRITFKQPKLGCRNDPPAESELLFVGLLRKTPTSTKKLKSKDPLPNCSQLKPPAPARRLESGRSRPPWSVHEGHNNERAHVHSPRLTWKLPGSAF